MLIQANNIFKNFVKRNDLETMRIGDVIIAKYECIEFSLGMIGIVTVSIDGNFQRSIDLFSEDCPHDILDRILRAYKNMDLQGVMYYVTEWEDITSDRLF